MCVGGLGGGGLGCSGGGWGPVQSLIDQTLGP